MDQEAGGTAVAKMRNALADRGLDETEGLAAWPEYVEEERLLVRASHGL